MRLHPLLLLTAAGGLLSAASPSSHREAPAIAGMPRVDGTDFYLFNSYASGDEDYVTVIANYLPLQDPYGGPNYFVLDPAALYEIHFDNDGDAVEDISFQFRFRPRLSGLTLPIGPPEDPVDVAVPFLAIGSITTGDEAELNLTEAYTVDVALGGRRSDDLTPVVEAGSGSDVFIKPLDNAGTKTLPDYEGYASRFQYDIELPDGSFGRMFVGQRKDPFVVNLGETFDLVNIADPLGAPDAEADDLADKNVTSFILELPKSFLLAGDQPVLGAWTTASLPQARVLDPRASFSRPSVQGGAWTQVSRLSAPLVNELVIGLPDKNRFNGSEPQEDAQFLTYVTRPTLPAVLEILFGAAGVQAPTAFPREDLVQAFLTGVPGLNDNGSTAEMLRLNTSIAPTPLGSQSRLGVIDGDVAGFPNGRRPGDDVVDIALRVAMGVLLPEDDAPSGQLPFTDGALVDASFFNDGFPYLRTPLPGSPNE